MDRLLTTLRQTRASKVVAVLRLLLGLLFLSTGLMKLLVPELREAFSGQLTQAAIPAHALNMWFVPLAEVAVGLLLLVGLFARLAALVGMAMMIVASYVHLTVHDPALFPEPGASSIPWTGTAARATGEALPQPCWPASAAAW